MTFFFWKYSVGACLKHEFQAKPHNLSPFSDYEPCCCSMFTHISWLWIIPLCTHILFRFHFVTEISANSDPSTFGRHLPCACAPNRCAVQGSRVRGAATIQSPALYPSSQLSISTCTACQCHHCLFSRCLELKVGILCCVGMYTDQLGPCCWWFIRWAAVTCRCQLSLTNDIIRASSYHLSSPDKWCVA